MSTITQMKCACVPCLCVIPIAEAIKKDDKYYCSQACAEGHVDGKGCGHRGCNC